MDALPLTAGLLLCSQVPGRSPDKCNLIPIEEEEEQEDAQTADLRQRCTQQALTASDAADLAAGASLTTNTRSALSILSSRGGDAWPTQHPLHQLHNSPFASYGRAPCYASHTAAAQAATATQQQQH
jgi:hypothetical protein